MGPALLFLTLAVCAMAALVRPWIGLVGYLGYALLMPQYIWSWDPTVASFPFQKYLAAATLVGFVLNGLRGNRPRGVALASMLCLVGFLGWSYLAAVGSIRPETTADFLDIVWKLVLMAVVACLLLNTHRRVTVAVWVLILAQAYNAYLINKGYFELGFCRAVWGGWGGTDNNGYSLITLQIMGLSAAWAYYGRRLWLRLLAGGVFLLQAHQIMLLESRGAMLGGLVMGGLFVWLVPKDRWSLTMIGGGLLAVAVLAGPSVVEEFSSAFAPQDELDHSAASRFDLWQAGWHITWSSPLVGYGPDCGRYMVPSYYPGGLDGEQKALHNLFFEISTGMGLPALALFLGFLLSVWWACLTRIRDRVGRARLPASAQAVLLGIAIGTPALLVSSMFSSSLQNESQYAVTALGVATLAILARESAAAGRATTSPTPHRAGQPQPSPPSTPR